MTTVQKQQHININLIEVPILTTSDFAVNTLSHNASGASHFTGKGVLRLSL